MKAVLTKYLFLVSTYLSVAEIIPYSFCSVLLEADPSILQLLDFQVLVQLTYFLDCYHNVNVVQNMYNPALGMLQLVTFSHIPLTRLLFHSAPPISASPRTNTHIYTVSLCPSASLCATLAR